MNGMMNREFLSQAAIVLAACVGGWMMLIEPRANELRELEAVIELAKSGDSVVTDDSVERLANRVSEMRLQVAEIQRRNRLAADSSQLYALVMDVAEDTGVEVQALEPGESSNATKEDEIRIINLDVTVSGMYASMADFLDRLKKLEGFVRPSSLQLAPKGDASRPIVTARIVCDVMGFALPEALAAMGGDAHAQFDG